jgi:HEAT repeat protein
MSDDMTPESRESGLQQLEAIWSERKAARRNDKRSDEELFHAALDAQGDDRQAEAVFTLRERGTREIYEAAAALCQSKKARERWCGVDVLGQFGYHVYGGNHPYHEETVSLFLDMIEREKRVTVLGILLWALAELDDPRAVEPIARFSTHANKWVRRQAAEALTHFAHDNEAALRHLIGMCSDPDRDVRDWATFGLGSQFDPGDLDLPEAHAVLWERADEDDTEIRAQAVRGLVFRGEKGLTERVIRELSTYELYDDVLEAAEFIADPALLPHLLPLRGTLDRNSDSLEDAIKACGGEAQAGG